jgi:outer membrane cobalamin receptor
MRAEDWHADNYEPIYNARNGASNPGRFDAVNIYGDEYSVYGNYSNNSPWQTVDRGLGTFYRTGYKESDLLDYSTSNLKLGAAVHIRLKPSEGFNSPEMILASNVGTGTTVYQGDNRFRLKNIFFNQNRVELKKEDSYFIRLYMTTENSGNSYDPYATALKIQQQARSTEDWTKIYATYWNQNVTPIISHMGYPGLVVNPNWNGIDLDSLYLPYNYDSLSSWLNYYQDSLFTWHQRAELYTNNNSNIASVDSLGYYAPGSKEFQDAFNSITSKKNNEGEGGTRFFDQSSLYHFQAQKIFKKVLGLDKIILGANGRLYTPKSDGTIFSDGNGKSITNKEGGMYLGLERHFLEDKMIVTGTVRADKNQNFNLLISPAASVVYSPKKNHWARVTFSSGLRNPTLTDQYLNLNVGPAILSGNLNGVDSLVTIPSFLAYRSALNRDSLKYFNIDPIRPEQVRSFELGYRATLWQDLYIDVSYYSSIYQHFIGYKIGLDVEFQENSAFPKRVQAYRYSANSTTTVRTQGLSVGANYYLGEHITLGLNYSWNELAKTDNSDPVIPAFNTPKNKYNVSLAARNYKLKEGSKNSFGASVNYKWIQGFLFEGSPQFTGYVNSYALVDAQINYTLDKAHTTFKLGCSNLFNNMQIQTYGGPRIGRLAYFSLLYEFQKH